MHRGRIKVFFALAAISYRPPDSELTAEALSRCRLTAHVSTKLNRAHLVTGRQALILPCLGRSEIDQRGTGHQFVTVEDSMGIINPSQGRFTPASEHLLSEPAIVTRLAEAVLGNKTNLPWSQWANDYDLVRDEIEQVIPVSTNSTQDLTGHFLPAESAERRKEISYPERQSQVHNQLDRAPSVGGWTICPDDHPIP